MVAALLVVVATAGCGKSGTSTPGARRPSAPTRAATTGHGGPVRVVEGEPLILDGLRLDFKSRYLDSRANGDAAYLAGEPAPSEGLRYAAVFVALRNEGDRPLRLPVMSIVDTAGTEHAAFPPTTPYGRRFGEVVGPHESQPALDAPRRHPARPSLLLFRLSPATDKLPLTLEVQGVERGEVRLALR